MTADAARQTAARVRRAVRPWLPHSLRTRLLIFLLAAVVLAGAVQGALAYRGALAEADALFDYHMEQTALALRSGLPVDARGLGTGLPAEDENHEFIVQVWTNEGLRIFESAVGAALPQIAVLGFTDVRARGATYRVFSLQSRSQVIQVAQNMAVRREMAGQLALRTLAPLAIMAPLLALAVWWVVSGSLAPVERVRRQVAQRQADDLSPVDGGALPDEVRPLVDELNLLLARVQRAFEAQQHFVADAAHELRSPLAALKLQVQGLQRAGDGPARDVAAARLAAGIDRATRLVEQLLALARQEARVAAGAPAQSVPLADLARQSVADAAPAAQERGIDLGLSQADGVSVSGHADALRILLRNLVDNAVKYTPDGGVVDVAVQAAAAADGGTRGGVAELVVEDSGPGIAAEERERVLARFHRAAQVHADGTPIAGSGLGLSIVQSIARMHGATLELGVSERLGGLRAAVRFPAQGGA
ncbi:ATP-binding protein [Paracidovorax wautersii]|uniref:histidine kinase n=1 Tax=Paracidovorax wautersii TaxID=1177982 RepID=A0ABU1I6A7_9BURK|nr:ATP-binding protein [Paracidovorax wautersii]MDR6212742.1 two-component system OmpR family sensor kinase [Paracidovorax wautersii]